MGDSNDSNSVKCRLSFISQALQAGTNWINSIVQVERKVGKDQLAITEKQARETTRRRDQEALG